MGSNKFLGRGRGMVGWGGAVPGEFACVSSCLGVLVDFDIRYQLS